MEVQGVDVLEEALEVGDLDLNVLFDELGGARARQLDLDGAHADLDLDRLEADGQLLERDALGEDLAPYRSKRHNMPALGRGLARLTDKGTLRKPRAH